MSRIKHGVRLPVRFFAPSVLVSVLALTSPAWATVISFAPLSQPGTGFNNVGSLLVQDGFQFTSSNVLGSWQNSSPNHPVGGLPSTSLTEFFAGAQTAMTQVGGGPFDLYGIDLAGYSTAGSGPFNVTFTGTRADSSTVQQTFSPFNANGSAPVLQSFSFNNFSDLVSVSFTQGTNAINAYQFNNIGVEQSVPPSPVINFPDFSSINGLQFNGIAARSGSAIRVTGGSPAQAAGSSFYTVKQEVDRAFSTQFQFQVSDRQGIMDDSGSNGGDGFAFVIQNSAENALGDSGAGLGYNSMSNSLAIEFDMFHNGPLTFDLGDADGNHIGIHSLGTAPNSAFESSLSPASLGNSGLLPIVMKDGAIHTVRIDYNAIGMMSVYLDDMVTPRLSVNVDLGSLLTLDNGHAWVGFTSGIADASANHDILNWTFNAVPEPSTFLLGGLGLLGLGVLARRKKNRHA